MFWEIEQASRVDKRPYLFSDRVLSNSENGTHGLESVLCHLSESAVLAAVVVENVAAGAKDV